MTSLYILTTRMRVLQQKYVTIRAMGKQDFALYRKLREAEDLVDRELRKLSKIIMVVSIVLLASSCAPWTQCVSESDKHIKGQRHRYSYDHSRCPKGGNYYRWLFFIKR